MIDPYILPLTPTIDPYFLPLTPTIDTYILPLTPMINPYILHRILFCIWHRQPTVKLQ